MSLLRRLIRWSMFLGFLGAVGAITFLFVRNSPRCIITGPLVSHRITADGSRLVTTRSKGRNCEGAPLQVWDTRSGRVVHEWFRDANVMRFSPSPDDRHAAIVLGDGRLRIVDGHTGKEWRFDEPPDDEAVNRADFSPGGRWLMVVTASCRTLYLIDVQACRVVMRMKDNWPVISADDRLVYYREGPSRAVTVHDIQQGKTLGTLALTANHFSPSTDGKLLLERHEEPIPAPPEEPGEGPFKGGVRMIERKDYRIGVWDLATHQRRFQHELKRAGNLEFMLSPDSRRLAMWLRLAVEPSNLEVIDTATGKLLWAFPMKRGENFNFAADSSLCYFVRQLDPKNSVMTMFDAETGRVLWEKPANGSTYFAMNGDILLYQEEFARPLHFVNARTGAVWATLPSNFRTANYIPVLTREGRHFVIGGWQMRTREPYFWDSWLEKFWPEMFGDDIDGALVMETATGREVFRVVNRVRESYRLSDDGSTLVTVDVGPEPDQAKVIRIWDMQPIRAWWWAVGVTAGIGLGLLAVRWMWRRRQQIS